MKKLVFAISFCIIGVFAYSQPWQSSNRLLSDSEVVLIDSDIDTSASVLLFGYFTGSLTASSGESVTSYGGRDYFIVKFDSLSHVEWFYNLGSTGFDYADGGMAVNEDGSVYLTGGFQNEFFYTPALSITSTGNVDSFILKYDTDGNVVWIKHSAQGDLNQRPNALETDINGDIIVSGFFSDSISFDGESSFTSDNAIDDIYYAKFSSVDGSLIWAKQIIGISNPGSGRIVAVSSGSNAYSLVGIFYDSIGFPADTLVSLDNTVDVFVINTDLDGNANWIRQISGNLSEFSYSIFTEEDGSVFLGGYYNSIPLIIDSTETEQITFDGYVGGFDLMFLKYSSSGILQWVNGTGGTATDKVWDTDPQAVEGMYTGSFTNTMMWGGIELTTEGGSGDVDMFVGVLNENGGFNGANSYGGRNNSREEGRAVFENNGKTYTVLRSDSDLLTVGDSTYLSPGGVFYLVLGVIECKINPSIDLVTPTDLNCYADSSGGLVVVASGGFGAPYRYSMDGGDSFLSNDGLFTNLPAGDFHIKVTDQYNCIGVGPSGTLNQPDSIQFSYTVSDPLCADSLFGFIEFGTPTGGSNAGWEFSVDSGATYQAMALFNDVTADSYQLVVKENKGCQSAIIDTIITSPDPLSFEFDLVNDSLRCFGDSDAEIHFKNITGGSGGTMYSIDGGANYQIDTFFVGLSSGMYHLMVSDINSCITEIMDTSIFQPEEILFSYTIEDSQCFGGTGTIAFEPATGGSGNYTYSVNGEPVTSTDTIFTDLVAGNYQLLVQDDSMCLSIALDTSIIEPDELVISDVISQDISSSQDGSIEVTASGGTIPYVFVLKPGDISQDNGSFAFTAGEGGTYTVEINDANNCGPISTDPVEILDLTSIQLSSFSDARVYPNPSTGQITVEMRTKASESNIEVLSLAGQVVSSTMAYPTGGQMKETLHLGDLAKGMYMLRIDGKILKSAIVLH